MPRAPVVSKRVAGSRQRVASQFTAGRACQFPAAIGGRPSVGGMAGLGAVMPSRPGEFHPEPLTDPDLNLSIHPARTIDRGLPSSVELRAHPVAGWPVSTSMTHPLRSTAITAASSLLRSSPHLSGASVLSALRCEPLAPFPLASPARFSRSVPKPNRASCCLHAGCRSVRIRTSSELISQVGSTRDFDIT